MKVSGGETKVDDDQLIDFLVEEMKAQLEIILLLLKKAEDAPRSENLEEDSNSAEDGAMMPAIAGR